MSGKSKRTTKNQRPDCPMERLPCGCLMGNAVIDDVPTFVYEPCSTSCGYYLYMVEQSKALGHPIELRSVD